MYCLLGDFGEEHRHNITANILKEGKQLEFLSKGEHENKSFKKINKANQSDS